MTWNTTIWQGNLECVYVHRLTEQACYIIVDKWPMRTNVCSTQMSSFEEFSAALRGRVLGALQLPGPAVFGIRNWWEWLAGYSSVMGLHSAQHPVPH